MGKYAASGGYYMALPAHKIFASQYTFTGSIGVFSLLFNLKDFEKKFGVSFPLVTGSQRRNLIGMGLSPSPEDKRVLQKKTKDIYQTFLERVSTGRKMKKSQAEKLAGGRVWTGNQARSLNLVDAIGNLDDAIAEAKKLGGFSDEIKVPLLQWNPPITTLKECLGDIKRCLYPSKKQASTSLLKLDFKKLNSEFIRQKLKEEFGESTQMLWPDYLAFD